MPKPYGRIKLSTTIYNGIIKMYYIPINVLLKIQAVEYKPADRVSLLWDIPIHIMPV